MTAISLQQLDKTYRSSGKAVRVVKSLNLDIADKEFLVLLGPSGCGKTTTMRMVAGLEEPSGEPSRLTASVSTKHRRSSGMWPWCFKTMACTRT